MAGLRDAGWLAGTVTTGQAYGGDVEAVTVHTGLLAARHVLEADVAIVTQGPGNLGHRHPVRVLRGGRRRGGQRRRASWAGVPWPRLRVSGADARPRHRGVSHHSLTAYGRVALVPADVVVPVYEGDLAELSALVAEQAAELGSRHRLVDVGLNGLHEALATSPVPLSTMGRGLDADPAAFLAAAAAGRHAAAMLRP